MPVAYESHTEDIKNILRILGPIKQLDKTKEELRELIDAIDTLNQDNITEEIADVEIMLVQLKAILGVSEAQIHIAKDRKIRRTLERVRGGYYETH